MTRGPLAQQRRGPAVADAEVGWVVVGRPRPLALVREAVAIAITQPVATGVAALITAAVCAVILATTGQAAASEQRVIASIDEAGARTLVFSDPTGRAEIAATGLDRIAGLPGVEWAVGLGPVTDVTAAPLGPAGQRVPARPMYGTLPPAIELIDGRTPQPGEALAGERAVHQLGLVDGAGAVAGDGYRGAVVGTFTAEDPLDAYNGGLLIQTEQDPEQLLRRIYVVARTTQDVETLQQAVPALLEVQERLQVAVDAPTTLVELQAVVAGELGEASRQLMLLVLIAGLTLIGITLYGATANRRRDFGRRRALGASRSAIVALVLGHTAFAAISGTILGTAIGTVTLQLLEGSQPAPSFTLGVATLSVLIALVAAVPPAAAAALRDPVRILRVP